MGAEFFADFLFRRTFDKLPSVLQHARWGSSAFETVALFQDSHLSCIDQSLRLFAVLWCLQRASASTSIADNVEGYTPHFWFFRTKHSELREGPCKVILRKAESTKVQLLKQDGIEVTFSIRVVNGMRQRLLDKAQATPVIRDSKLTRALDKVVDVKPVLFSGRLFCGPLDDRSAKRWYREAHGNSLGSVIEPILTTALRAHFDQTDDQKAWESAIMEDLNKALQASLHMPVKQVTLESRKPIDVDLEEYQSRVPSVVSLQADPAPKKLAFYWDAFLRTLPFAIIVSIVLGLILFACPDLLSLLFFIN